MGRAAIRLVLATCFAAGPAFYVSAEEAIGQYQTEESRPTNPCAHFGPGYSPLGSTQTCIRIGGSIRFDIGGGDIDDRDNGTGRKRTGG
ncbi:porin-like protein [Rhizobium subbaraonis]|uniref:Porin n=1 Tax=Rhizobium subbaraonis TaxID=908946 RepID=A0A285UE42_9HYPH|nr:porin [Rhizobium subbaraonis]SOC39937.1 porin-like protein [Rhizobium subbaraonis]